MKKKVLFVVQVGSSFWAWFFVNAQMVLFNDGNSIEVEDMRGVELVAKAAGFTNIVFHQHPQGKWEVK